MKSNIKELFQDDKTTIEVIRLADWLDWAASGPESVALPMIQRGSVWKPNQIIDLWDTLLRGMPVGSLMVTKSKKGDKVIGLDKPDLAEVEGGLNIIDGQQRTLSMLIPWINQVKMDRRLWVDFGEKQPDGYLFRLHITTKNQPFGFQKANPSVRLSLYDRRKAILAHCQEQNIDPNKIEKNYDFFANAKPWESMLAIEFDWLMERWRKCPETWVDLVIEKLKSISHLRPDGYDSEHKEKFKEVKWDVTDKIRSEQIVSEVYKFRNCLESFFKLQIPLIEVKFETFQGNENKQDDNDPPLAVLFKRIGTGGTPLSDADYVYSIIKHRIPDSYTLVEDLHKDETIKGLLTATDLVMTAVRLAATEYRKSEETESNNQREERFSDFESPNKAQFHRMASDKMFLEEKLLSLIKNDTNDSLEKSFDDLKRLLKYEGKDGKGKVDIGLPKHALQIIKRPLLQVLLRWVRIIRNENNLEELLRKNREDILRFIMFWQLCVLDDKKASTLAFKKLNEYINENLNFPGKKLYEDFICDLGNQKIAVSIISPKNLAEANKHYLFSEPTNSNIGGNDKFLRGWTRFWSEESEKSNKSDDEKKARDLYSRWWSKNSNTYTHSILLWLQREMVSELVGETIAGRDEEDNSFDYDHICPASHWYDCRNEHKITNFNDSGNDGHWRIGNSIGNIRVWDSSDNRSDGDATPREKLRLDGTLKDQDQILKKSAIPENDIELWKICSSSELKYNKYWTKERAIAFQSAVERRAFYLYKKFYDDLEFSAWIGDTKN